MMKRRLYDPLRFAVPVSLAALLLVLAPGHRAAAQQPDAKSIVASAVHTELTSDLNDHTPFMYLDHDMTPDHNTLFFIVETPQGNLKRKLQDHGHPLDQTELAADNQRIQGLLNDSAAVARRRHDESHDDDQAAQMLKLLPVAYLWTIASEQGDLITLDFRPDPNFSPGSLEAHVLSSMAGQLVVARHENRIRSIKGTLVNDVTFAWGLFGRLHKGGSFEVQRRQVAPGHWQMTENHTHIQGKALFFKTIGAQEDEVRSDFKISPAQNVQQAWEILQHQTP